MSSDLLVQSLRERAKNALEEGNMTARCDAEYFTQSANVIEALDAEVVQLREVLQHMSAYLKLWSDDVDAALKPTRASLAEASFLLAEIMRANKRERRLERHPARDRRKGCR